MFMFALTRRPDTRKAPARDSGGVSVSRLGKGVKVRGILEIEGEIVVSGQVFGRIAALKVTIAPDGFVEGDIVAREVVIGGKLEGRVYAPTVLVEVTAQVTGKLFHHTIEVMRGARVDGRTPWRPVNFFETLDHLPEA
jgi:cytoskeletal protein CcmA (bactofilin family)